VNKFGKLFQNGIILKKIQLGKQLVRATDSIAVNLSEGFGRFHYKEAKNFDYYSRGSLYEAKTWLTKANNRNLLNNDQFKEFTENINLIGKMLNKYISSIGQKYTNNYFNPMTNDQ
jgi:four helix bundle protein